MQRLLGQFFSLLYKDRILSIPIFAQANIRLYQDFGINLSFWFQADIDLSKRAGELSEEEVEKIITIMSNPRQYKIPDWFLNRQKDIKDGKSNYFYGKCEDIRKLQNAIK